MQGVAWPMKLQQPLPDAKIHDERVPCSLLPQRLYVGHPENYPLEAIA
jgi:hypothetical protein